MRLHCLNFLEGLSVTNRRKLGAITGLCATGEYAGARLAGGGTVCKNQLQASGKHTAEKLRAQSATGAYAGASLTGGGVVQNQLQQRGKEVGDERGYRQRTKPWVQVRASREDEEFAVFSGSFSSAENHGVVSVRVVINATGKNKEKYKQMLDKYDKDKQNFKNAVDLPASTLKLAFDTDTKLEDIVKSLAECSPDKPIPVFRRGKFGRVLEADEATNWKFEVIGYLSAEAKIAEQAAAATDHA